MLSPKIRHLVFITTLCLSTPTQAEIICSLQVEQSALGDAYRYCMASLDPRIEEGPAKERSMGLCMKVYLLRHHEIERIQP